MSINNCIFLDYLCSAFGFKGNDVGATTEYKAMFGLSSGVTDLARGLGGSAVKQRCFRGATPGSLTVVSPGQTKQSDFVPRLHWISLFTTFHALAVVPYVNCCILTTWNQLAPCEDTAGENWGGMSAPSAISASISGTVRGTHVMSSIPSDVTTISSSMRTWRQKATLRLKNVSHSLLPQRFCRNTRPARFAHGMPLHRKFYPSVFSDINSYARASRERRYYRCCRSSQLWMQS